MAFGVRHKLLAFAGMGVLTTLVVGGVGYHSASRQTAAMADVQLSLSTLRNHLEGDMMHDAMRSDVLGALLAARNGHRDRVALEGDVKAHFERFSGTLTENRQRPLPPDMMAALEAIAPSLSAYGTSAVRMVSLAFTDLKAAEADMPDFSRAFSQLERDQERFADLVEANALQAQKRADEQAADALAWMAATIVVASVTFLLAAILLMAGILRPLAKLRDAISALHGDGADKAAVDAADERLTGFQAEFLGIQQAFNLVLDDLDAKRAREQARARDALRIQQALDVANVNIVLTDPDLNIVYVNQTGLALFARCASELTRDIPNFDPATLCGRNIGMFLRDPELRRRHGDLGAPRSDEVQLGGRTFQVEANPVRQPGGERVGVVYQWNDLTEQRNAETQIERVLAAAVAGQLDTRLDLEGFRGFTRTLAGGLNQVLDAIVAPLRVAASQLQQIAAGDIPQPITTEFRGEFNEIRRSLNTCTDVLRRLMKDVGGLVDAAAAGVLDKRADASQHWGDYGRIVEGVNKTLDAVVGPMAETQAVMSALAAGDLRRRMDGHYVGAFAELQTAVNTSIDNLLRTVARITGAAQSINASSIEIAKGNQDLNTRTQHQAQSLEETTVSLQTLTAKVRQAVEHARQANDRASVARTQAENGGQVVQDAVAAMREISASSRRMADIISVIDGIAFQTNLLALNASVEAARAGSEGRGFAVVASEVRSLAGRTAAAAREIKQLIDASTLRVSEGTMLVDKSGATFVELIDGVKQVSTLIEGIAAASRQQIDDIDIVNTELTQMDDVTQQNAALVEEATSASESMSQEAHALSELMGFFQTGSSPTMTRATGSTGSRSGRSLKLVARSPRAAAASPR